jgi:hypothetical protein
MNSLEGGREIDSVAAERNERAVLESLVRALRHSEGSAATLSAICRHCKAGLPQPVIDEVLRRLIAQGNVARDVKAESGAGISGSQSVPSNCEDAFYLITEIGYERYNTLTGLEAEAKLAELQARIISIGLSDRHRKMWASMHDYLMWKPGRTIQFTNYGLGFKLTPDEIWQYREMLFNLGLIERGVIEAHIQLTEVGARCPRLPADNPRFA